MNPRCRKADKQRNPRLALSPGDPTSALGRKPTYESPLSAKSGLQLLLGHTELESTVRYLGIEVDDALEMAEQTEV